jgi:glutamate dehydrogenase (NADP+)
MTELHHHIGPTTDIPAGDIGVGTREIGYLYGAYRRMTRRFDGAITGKGLTWGGSIGRTEATGYGCVYFAEEMLRQRQQDLKGKTCLVSGSGNVATYTIEKLYHLGAIPISCSDTSGTIHHPSGIDLDSLKLLKQKNRQSLAHYAERHPDATFIPVADYPDDGHAIWRFEAQAAFPCATQNELTRADAEALLNHGVICICEGANMPATPEAVAAILDSGIAYGPGKAANAGGVATSHMEMQQNASLTQWSLDEVDTCLRKVMVGIHLRASEAAAEFGEPNNLMLGANIAGFRRVAHAMIEQGVF